MAQRCTVYVMYTDILYVVDFVTSLTAETLFLSCFCVCWQWIVTHYLYYIQGRLGRFLFSVLYQLSETIRGSGAHDPPIPDTNSLQGRRERVWYMTVYFTSPFNIPVTYFPLPIYKRVSKTPGSDPKNARWAKRVDGIPWQSGNHFRDDWTSRSLHCGSHDALCWTSPWRS